MFQPTLTRALLVGFALAAPAFAPPVIGQSDEADTQQRRVFGVLLVGEQGEEIKGFVDPVTDAFVIESWTNASSSFWTPAASQIPLSLYAFAEDGQRYDVPEHWDGKLAGWAFLLPVGSDSRSVAWNEGTPTEFWEGVSFGWGGMRNRRGEVVISQRPGDPTRQFRYVPKSERTIANIWLKDAKVTSTTRAVPDIQAKRASIPTTERIVDQRTGHAYQRINIPMSWHEAKQYCEEHGGHLVTITTPEENEFVYRNFARDHVCWLGATDEVQEGQWRWVSGEAWNYDNWKPSEPNNMKGGEHYAMLGRGSFVVDGRTRYYGNGPLWNDHPSDGVYYVPLAHAVCEWDDTPPSRALAWDFSEAQREVLIRDDFEGQSAVAWDIRRADPNRLSLSKRPGYLCITTQRGDIFGSAETGKNIYLTAAPEPFDIIELTTCIEGFAPTGDWQQAGLLCLEDEDHYVKFTIENAASGERRLVQVLEFAGRPIVLSSPDPFPQAQRLWLRMTKCDDSYVFSVSADGKKYTQLGVRSWAVAKPLSSPKYVGLVALNGIDSRAPEIDAFFDRFEVCRLTKKTGPLTWTLDEALNHVEMYPRDSYAQYVAMQLARRERDLEPTVNGIRYLQGMSLEPRPNRRNDADLFSIFTGALAVQESLQLEEMGGGIPDRRRTQTTPDGGGTIPIAKLVGPSIKSHPWKEMLGGWTPEVSSLSQSVPDDYYFVLFRSVNKLFEVMTSTDLWSNHLLNQSVQDARTTLVGERVQQQLAMAVDNSLLEFYADTVEEVAVTGSDLYVSEGSDISLLFKLKQFVPFRKQMDAGLAEIVQTTPGVKREQIVVQGIPVEYVSTPDRQIHVFSAYPSPKLHVRCNSLVALEKVLAAVRGQNADGERVSRLGDTDEFRYIRTLMQRGSLEEDGFVYLSDPFIRRMVGAEVKLTERRRMLCYNHLRMIGHASLLYSTEHGRTPESLEELVAAKCIPAEFGKGHFACPDGGEYRLSEDGHTGVCTHHGHTHWLTPCCEIPVTEATASEALLYETFVEDYNGYWTTFFDPIALRIQATPERYRIETIILPLIDNTVYAGLASILGSKPEPLDVLPVPDRNIFSMAVRVNKRPILAQLGLEGLLDEPEEKPKWEARGVAVSQTLRQIVLAHHNYHDSYGTLPTAVSFDGAGNRNRLSWRVHLLPFLDQQALYSKFHLNEPWDSPHNKSLVAQMPEIYRPDNPQLAATGKTRIVVPFGEKCVFSDDKNPRGFQHITDGTSNTILVLEADDEHAVVWTKPDDLAIDPSKPKRGVQRREPGGYVVAMADGSIHFFREQIDDQKLAALLTRSGREVVRILSQDEIFLERRRNGPAWRVDGELIKMGLGELLAKGVGNQIGMHIYDDEPLFGFSLPQLLGWSMGSMNSRRGMRFDDDMLAPIFLIASLNAPVYVSIPVQNGDIVDGFLDRLDDYLAIQVRHRQGSGFFRIDQDFYHLEDQGDIEAPTRVYGVRLGPVSWQVYWARIGDGVYIASQKSVLDDLRDIQSHGSLVQADHGPPAHAMARIRPEHWDRVLASYRLGWEANNRQACLQNIGPISSLGRAAAASQQASPYHVTDRQLAEASAQVYGVQFYCPGGGQYSVSPDGKSASCSLHGTAYEPHQHTAPAEQSQVASLVRDVRDMTVTLTFLEDGLHAVVQIDRKASSPKSGGPHDAAGGNAKTEETGKADRAVLLQHVEPTTVGPIGRQRHGIQLQDVPILQDDRLRLEVSLADEDAKNLSITRLFLCREMSVPYDERSFTSLDVNLWVPVPDGPITQVAVQQQARGSLLLRPQRPLPDGVYALHSGDLQSEDSPAPAFFAPFVVRGYGVPEVAETTVKGSGATRSLDVSVRNTGDGAFDDGFLVVTLQRREGERSKFMRRRHGPMASIPPGEGRTISQKWDTSGLAPGTYYFYGHVNYKYLWDVNSLDNFRSDDFVVAEDKEE